MDTKDIILNNLRNNVREKFSKPKIDFLPLIFPDAVEAFIKTAVTSAGASVVELKPGEDLNDVIKREYPDAKIISSSVPGIKAHRNPDLAHRPHELDGTDVSVVSGGVACAENACIWVPQTMKERAVCFICEYLVIIIERNAIVSNMHEAYARIEMSDYGFGTFISGPSKTADIEQALVYGAQSFCGVTIIIK